MTNMTNPSRKANDAQCAIELIEGPIAQYDPTKEMSRLAQDVYLFKVDGREIKVVYYLNARNGLLAGQLTDVEREQAARARVAMAKENLRPGGQLPDFLVLDEPVMRLVGERLGWPVTSAS
jgi:hypothetical protein